MIKFLGYQSDCFSEVPGEISLCINITNCPHRCDGCHSPELQEDIGEELTTEKLDEIIKKSDGITCVCFMGGDGDKETISNLAKHVKDNYDLNTAWYSGEKYLNRTINIANFDYIKIGSYKPDRGPLTSKTTNQIMFAKGYLIKKPNADPRCLYDITDRFWK